MALSATLHCLTGCAIGEIAGLMIGTAIGLSTGLDDRPGRVVGVPVRLPLSTLPLLKTGLGFGAALSIVFAADTLSIATMEVVDNAVMALIPGAMDAGLVNATFWISMMIALTAAFFAAYPVNRYLLQRGKGHALTHGYHGRECRHRRAALHPDPGDPDPGRGHRGLHARRSGRLDRCRAGRRFAGRGRRLGWTRLVRVTPR